MEPFGLVITAAVVANLLKGVTIGERWVGVAYRRATRHHRGEVRKVWERALHAKRVPKLVALDARGAVARDLVKVMRDPAAMAAALQARKPSAVPPSLADQAASAERLAERSLTQMKAAMGEREAKPWRLALVALVTSLAVDRVLDADEDWVRVMRAGGCGEEGLASVQTWAERVCDEFLVGLTMTPELLVYAQYFDRQAAAVDDDLRIHAEVVRASALHQIAAALTMLWRVVLAGLVFGAVLFAATRW